VQGKELSFHMSFRKP